MKIIINIMNTCMINVSHLFLQCKMCTLQMIFDIKRKKCAFFFALPFFLDFQSAKCCFIILFNPFFPCEWRITKSKSCHWLFIVYSICNRWWTIRNYANVELNRLNGIWVQKSAYHWAPNYHMDKIFDWIRMII